MPRLKRVDEELSGFIFLGGIMDEPLRRMVAEMLFLYLYDPQFDALARLENAGLSEPYPNWFVLLQKIFADQQLLKLTLNNEDFAFSVARETLNWCKKTALKFEKAHNYTEEENRLRHLQNHLDASNADQWNQIVQSLNDLYPQHSLNWKFYLKTLLEDLEEIAQISDQRRVHILENDLRVVKGKILRDWSNFLREKKHGQEANFLAEHFESYHQSLLEKIDKVEELNDMLSPFYNFLGSAWNDTLGAWNKIDWSELEEYAKKLRRDRQLRELADLLGRWQRAVKDDQELKMRQPLPKEDWKPNPYGKSEIIGIHHSNQLSALLPSEIALLSSPETELILAKKYAERKLLTFQYRSQDISHEETQHEIPSNEKVVDERGPIIMCIDTSGSMFGAPERIAKALALAILNIAIKQKRRAFLISFSTGIRTMEISGIEGQTSQMVDFLKMSFHGGTDLHPALEEALKVLKKEYFQNADILVISDFVIPRLDKDLYDDIQDARLKYGTHFHSLFITRRPDPRIPPLPIFDNHWLYDLDNPKVVRQMVDHFKILDED